jgi:hypothetical protein
MHDQALRQAIGIAGNPIALLLTMPRHVKLFNFSTITGAHLLRRSC